MEKVKIDIEEAKFQANQRKEAIEKASTMVYYQTDRVKTFHVSNTGRNSRVRLLVAIADTD